MRAARSASDLNTTARPVCCISAGVAAEVGVTADPCRGESIAVLM